MLGWIGMLLLGGMLVRPACGQPGMLPETRAYQARSVANLFVTLDDGDTVDGLIARLPAGWRLREAVVLRYGSERVPAQVEPAEASEQYLIRPDRPLSGPHEVALRVDIGSAPGIVEWSVVPFVQDESGRTPLEARRETHRVEVERLLVGTASDNHALRFTGASPQPIQLRRRALPAIGPEADFTVEFWLKTTGLDEVVLSAWSGQEEQAYPMEFVIDESGRLRYYCGEPGRHQGLMTPGPIADGRWHHIALTHEQRTGQLRLVLEGTPVDSMTSGRLPDDPTTATLALGGRPSDAFAASSEEEQPVFTGSLDEVRFWSTARAPAAVRRLARRTLDAEREGRVSLSFESEIGSSLLAEPGAGWERVPSDLQFRTPIRSLRASVQAQDVRLTWEAASARVNAFVIERSTDGQTFERIDRVPPQRAQRSTTEDAAQYEYVDPNAPGQVVFYRIRQQFADGTERVSGTLKIGLGSAPEQEGVQLIGNFPNPFGEATTVAYEVHERQEVTVSVWDLSGQRVAQLATGTHAPGYYEKRFQASDLPSGTYFVRLQTPEKMKTRKMVVLK